METVNIRQLYDSDPRPTFIVDCQAPSAAICYVNLALLAIPSIANCLNRHDSLRDFWDPASRVAACQQQEFRHGRYRWAKFRFEQFLVVTIIEQPPQSDEARDRLQETAQLSKVTSPLQSLPETIFTVRIQSRELRDHIECIRKIDWASTPLGPISNWSYELNFLITTLMLETRPTALFLGPEHIVVYNLAYGAVSGSRHPNILGKSIIDAWPELADPVSATMERSQQTRFADAPENEYHFMVERYGFVEESFFRWSLVPLVGPIDGMYSIVTEVTKQRLLERRVKALLRVGQLTSEARNIEAFWLSVYEAIKPHEYDFPTAALYSHSAPGAGDFSESDKSASKKCSLEWTIGYRVGHPALPKFLEPSDDHGLAHAISESTRKGLPTFFREEDGVLPQTLFQDIKKRGFGDPCKAFIIIPIRIYDETTKGYLVVGLNTRRPYDAEYQEWVEVFSNLLGASAASSALYEEEVRNRKRQEEQAIKDREALNAEVAFHAREASDVAEKLQNFRDVASGVGLGYFEFDVDGRLLHANDAYFAQTGHQRDLATAPPLAFMNSVYEADLDLAMKQWRKTAGGESVTYEIRWKKKLDKKKPSENDTRDYLWTLTTCAPIRSGNGVVQGVFGCNTDISAQKEATRAAVLRMEAEKRLASFTELAPVGLYHLDASLNITYCNDQWFRITNHPRVPVDLINWRSVILEEDLESIYRNVQIISRKKGQHSFEFRLKTTWRGPDGVSTPTWLLATATSQLDGNGLLTSIFGTMTDISQLKWAEAVQKDRFEQALESKRQQENFIDMTSHEMRNPLSAMVQCADSISSSLGEMASLTDEGTFAAQCFTHTKLKALINNSVDAIETILACATHQKRIVDDILTLSKLDSKLLVISPITMQPTALLQDTYKMFKDEASKAGVNLEVQCDPSIADLDIDYAIVDPSRVLQVLINLVTNAIKFTQDQSTKKVEVVMGASLNEGKRLDVNYITQAAPNNGFLEQPDYCHGDIFYLHFTVRDTGCGLSPEHKAKLFLRFEQATPKTHVQYGGSGLGLFISRELTEMQGGSIGVQSMQGVGSIFSFYIKSRRVTPPSMNTTSIDMANRTEAHIGRNIDATLHKHSSSQTHPNYHVLVVEDNIINQRVLCNQLKKSGCTIQVANHGGEALIELLKTTYSKEPTVSPPFNLSVVLMDIEMPIMDGLTCTRRIRELQEKGDFIGHIPIIAVSANARREQIEQAKQAGMDSAISKPFRIPELMDVIDELLRGKGTCSSRGVLKT